MMQMIEAYPIIEQRIEKLEQEAAKLERRLSELEQTAPTVCLCCQGSGTERAAPCPWCLGRGWRSRGEAGP